MIIAEVLLRIGCSIVAWLVIYTHCLWLALTWRLGCQADGDELWRVLLGLAPITMLFSLISGASRKVHSVHNSIRWGAAPLVILVPLGFMAIWPVFSSVNLGSNGICSIEPKAWHPWWAPLQLVTLGVILLMAWRNWQPKPL